MLKLLPSIILFLTALSSFAQVPDDSTYKTDVIEVSSFFGKTDIFSSPSAVYSLSRQDIKSLNGNNLGEILEYVPGVFIKNYGSGSALQTIALNGLGAEHTVILLNGSKLNSLQNSQVDLSLIPNENIKSIEILSNGYSSLFGSDAIGGVVNIITDDLSGVKSYNVNLNTSYGSYNTRKLGLSMLGRAKNAGWNISFSNEKSDNNYDYIFLNGLLEEEKQRENAFYSNTNLSLSGEYNFSDKLLAKLQSRFTDSDKEVPGIETGNTLPLTTQRDRNWNNIFTLKYVTGNIIFSNEINFQNNLMNYKNLPFINSYYKNIVAGNLFRMDLNVKEHLLIFGAEARYGSVISNELENGAERKQYSLFNSSTIDFKSLKIFPSLRYDYISDIDENVITYKLGANYKPVEKINFHIRANISRNYSAPTFNALYWKTGGNKNLKPEESINTEAGFIISGKYFASILLDISYLNIKADNRIIWLPGKNFIWTPQNVLNSESNIVNSNLVLEFEPAKHLIIKTELSYTHNRTLKTASTFPDDPSLNKQIIYIPLEQIKFKLGIAIKYLEANIMLNHIGKRFSDTENLNPMEPSNLLDANISYLIEFANLSARLKFEVNNLTNTNYQYISGYPMPLRNYLLTLNLNYIK